MNVESNWVLFPTPSPKLNRVKEGGGGGGGGTSTKLPPPVHPHIYRTCKQKERFHWLTRCPFNALKGIDWPKGTYGLQMAKSGCPSGTWHRGTRFQDTEDDSPSNSWSSPYDVAGNVQRNNMEQRFCIKTNSEGSSPWPKGEYCILKKGDCPAG